MASSTGSLSTRTLLVARTISNETRTSTVCATASTRTRTRVRDYKGPHRPGHLVLRTLICICITSPDT
eukprot:scaffold650969_cov45-Prasinocladus_malaysianus.AAC.2